MDKDMKKPIREWQGIRFKETSYINKYSQKRVRFDYDKL